jgi:hypothetical protein
MSDPSPTSRFEHSLNVTGGGGIRRNVSATVSNATISSATPPSMCFSQCRWPCRTAGVIRLLNNRSESTRRSSMGVACTLSCRGLSAPVDKMQ